MRIGILTLPLRYNYGGILQAYALQTVLARKGHEVVVFDKKLVQKEPQWFVYFFRIIKKILFNKRIAVFKERKNNSFYPLICKNTRVFVDKYINCFEYDNLNDILIEQFDAVVVGSDQIWRKLYFCGAISPNYLDAYLLFAKNKKIKRISYAASFGIDSLECDDFEREGIKDLLCFFDAVSVREKSGVEICKKYFDVNVNCVLDPTMLLTKDDYLTIISSPEKKHTNRTLFCYILDGNSPKESFVKKVAEEKGLSILSVNGKPEDKNACLSERVSSSVESWLEGMFYSDFIVTDSFHACVFSVIFEKPFVVIANESRGTSRIKTLLETFGLLDHYLSDVVSYDSKKDYVIPQETYSMLSVLRKSSMDFIEQSVC